MQDNVVYKGNWASEGLSPAEIIQVKCWLAEIDATYSGPLLNIIPKHSRWGYNDSFYHIECKELQVCFNQSQALSLEQLGWHVQTLTKSSSWYKPPPIPQNHPVLFLFEKDRTNKWSEWRAYGRFVRASFYDRYYFEATPGLKYFISRETNRMAHLADFYLTRQLPYFRSYGDERGDTGPVLLYDILKDEIVTIAETRFSYLGVKY